MFWVTVKLYRVMTQYSPITRQLSHDITVVTCYCILWVFGCLVTLLGNLGCVRDSRLDLESHSFGSKGGASHSVTGGLEPEGRPHKAGAAMVQI